MTTPEQLAKWRKDFESQLLPATEMHIDVLGKYCINGLESQWQGYLRRCQETEQAIKYARKQALEDVAEGFIKQKAWLRDYAFAVVEHAAQEGATK